MILKTWELVNGTLSIGTIPKMDLGIVAFAKKVHKKLVADMMEAMGFWRTIRLFMTVTKFNERLLQWSASS